MMPPEEIRGYLRQRPFVPIRLNLTDGRSLTVHHPDNILLTTRVAVIGLHPGAASEGDEPPLPERTETVALIHVVSVEPEGARGPAVTKSP